MRKAYRNDVLAAVHETASDLHDAGVMSRRTLRTFDALCLTPVTSLSGEEIKAIREREQISQAVFARHLNVSKGIVSKWERGEKHPSGASLKLLALVRDRGLAAIA